MQNFSEVLSLPASCPLLVPAGSMQALSRLCLSLRARRVPSVSEVGLPVAVLGTVCIVPPSFAVNGGRVYGFPRLFRAAGVPSLDGLCTGSFDSDARSVPHVGAGAVGSSGLCAAAPCSSEHTGVCAGRQASQWSSTTAALRAPAGLEVRRLEGGEPRVRRRWDAFASLAE